MSTRIRQGGLGATSRPVTMREVAALAGVGIKTVSRVVNGEAGVSAATVAKVQAAIGRLDYQRDLNASMLRRLSRKTDTIGLVLEDVGNPFSSALNRAVEDAARSRGVLVFTGSCDEDPEREREIVTTLRERRVDGILLVPVGDADHSYLVAERQAGTSIVFLDRPARFLDADSVTSDNHGGAQEAVDWLADHGHRRIALLGDEATIHTARERLAGYRAAVARRNLDADDALVRSGIRGAAAAEAIATEMLRGPRPPTAIFAAQNLVTIGVIHALRALGQQHGVALVGFDDFELADMLDPSITVVAQNPVQLGRVAAGLLFARLDGTHGPSHRITVDVKLIVRGSGEIVGPGAA